MSNLTYPETPKYFCEFQVEETFPVEVMTSASGKEQRVADGSVSRIAYAVSYPLLSDAEATTLRDFYRAHGGTLDSFLFTAIEPGGTVSRRVRFNAFSLTHRFNATGGRRWAAQVELAVVT